MFFSIIIYLISPLARIFMKKARGLENLPSKRPYIIAVNHTSFADPIFLTVALRKRLGGGIRQIVFIAKRKIIWLVFTYRVAEKLFNLLIINPRRREKIIERAEKALSNKKILAIFFEGTRSWTGRVQKGKTGTVRIALNTKLPVVPIGLVGTRDFWPRGKIFPRFKKNIQVNVGKLISFEKYYTKKIDKKILRKLTGIIEDEVKELLKQK
jgi:1-acyl-sn-glycerol-3-phosphate acyltransferase